MNSGPPKDRTAEREAKLAQALRANLRRRKAPPKPGDRPTPPPDAPDADST
jgi:hypothetical protein